MPNIVINRNYLLGLIGNQIKKEELEEIIYKLGFEVEHSEENEFTIEITSNRPDLFSAVGVARAIRNFLHINKNFHYAILKKNNPILTITCDNSVEKAGLFISGLVVKNLKLDQISLVDLFNFSDKLSDTIGRMRKKMAIGMHNLDTIENELIFTLSDDEKFIPLKGEVPQLYSDIVKNSEKGKIYSKALPKNNKYPTLKDSKGSLALIPIINSKRTTVTVDTKNMFIDITGSSKELVQETAKILGTTFLDLGAELFPVTIKSSKGTKISPDFSVSYINIALKQIEDELGIKIGFNNIISLANKMGYEAALLGKKIRFTLPPYRTDIFNEQDIIEDICIAYGYDFISPIPVKSIIPGSLLNSNKLFEKLSTALVGAGFTESMSTYLTNEDKNFLKMNIEIPKSSDYVKLKDAKSSNLSMARTWILPSLLNVIALSKHDKMPQRVFELDMVFRTEDIFPIERYHIAGIVTDSHSNFNYIKSVLESIFSISSIPFSIKEFSHKSFIEGRCASVIINGVQVGFFGELHPCVLSNFGIEEPSVAFEIEL